MELEVDSPSDDVRAAVAQLQNPEVAKEPEQTELPLEAETEEKPDRARDELGRFAKSDKTEEPAKEESKTASKDAATPEQKQSAKSAPPTRLSKEAKAIWDSVHPSIQAEWMKFEADTSKGVEKLKTEHQTALQRYNEVDQALAPRREFFRQNGFQTDGQALQHLFSFSDAYQRDPTATVAHLASQPGVDRSRLLSMLTNGAAPQQVQQQPQFQQQQQPVDIRSAIQEEIGLANAKSQVEQFASDQSFPHFHLVRPQMAEMLNNGQAATLEEAYEKAVDAVPALKRLAELEAAQQKANEDAAKAAKQLEAKKRAANASLSGSPGGAIAGTKKPNGRASSSHFDDAVEDVRAAISSLS